MVAAPWNYSFWTKIYLNWLWVVEVADRWWAIVRAWVRWHSCDRIDIWTWWWETWLKRALYWWKRKVYWNFVSKKSKVTLNIKKFPAPNYVLKAAKKVYINPVFSKWIWTKNPKSDIIALQKYLKKKCLYNWPIDWDYYKILWIIYDIQKQNNIIKTGKEIWAWYWSYNTRQLFLQWKIKNWKCKKIIKKINKIQNKKEKINKEEKNIYPLENILEKPCWKNTDKKIVKKYQEFLKEIWLYKGEINWNYNNIIWIIIDFQLKEKLIKNDKELAAWFIWPKTREKLRKKYRKYIDEKIKIQKEKEEKEKQKKLFEEQKNKEVSEIVNKIAKLEKWAKGENVIILQRTLKHFWFFDYEETWYFWEKTQDSLIQYQISRKIIKSKEDIWAWYVWPKTRENLKKDMLKDESLLWKLKKIKFYVVKKIIKKV
jgi:hypothetical protein